MPALSSSGTQSAVINTEHVLYNPMDNRYYFGYIDLSNMLSGDTTEIRVYVIAKSGGNYILYLLETYSGIQSNPLLYIPPLPSDTGWRLTLKQTTGTGRNYDWTVFESA